jgi:hypothetical protein
MIDNGLYGPTDAHVPLYPLLSGAEGCGPAARSGGGEGSGQIVQHAGTQVPRVDRA